MTKEWTNKWNETQNILKVRTVKRCRNLTVLASAGKLFFLRQIWQLYASLKVRSVELGSDFWGVGTLV